MTEFTRALQYFINNNLDDLIPAKQINGECVSPIVTERILALVSHCQKIKSFPNVNLSNFSEFELLFPFLDKTNYISKYSISERQLKGGDFIHFSSGTTGQPTLWTRSPIDELFNSVRFEQIFKDIFEADKLNTLAMVCLPLGTWVGGMFTSFAMRYLSIKEYKIKLVTPGANLDEIQKVFQILHTEFDQVVFLGYPPFMKQFVDSFDLSTTKCKLGMVLAGESFAEEWRDVICSRANMSPSSIISIYGTSDSGVLATETKLSIYIRRILSNNQQVAKKLFKSSRLPTLMQYDPSYRYFEVHDEKLVITALPFIYNADIESCLDSISAPLVRYAISDAGSITSLENLLGFLKENLNVDIPPYMEYRKLPFVWVFGRASWTVHLYGANVYVENIMSGLEQPNVCDLVSSKFVLDVHEDDQGKRLFIAVELAPNLTPSKEYENQISEAVLLQLRILNSEFKNYVPESQQKPIFKLLENGDSTWFPKGGKHKYTKSIVKT